MDRIVRVVAHGESDPSQLPLIGSLDHEPLQDLRSLRDVGVHLRLVGLGRARFPDEDPALAQRPVGLLSQVGHAQRRRLERRPGRDRPFRGLRGRRRLHRLPFPVSPRSNCILGHVERDNSAARRHEEGDPADPAPCPGRTPGQHVVVGAGRLYRARLVADIYGPIAEIHLRVLARPWVRRVGLPARPCPMPDLGRLDGQDQDLLAVDLDIRRRPLRRVREAAHIGSQPRLPPSSPRPPGRGSPSQGSGERAAPASASRRGRPGPSTRPSWSPASKQAPCRSP